MAREKLHVVSIIFNNASYSVLNVELERVGADEVGPKAQSQLDLSGPTLNFALLAQGTVRVTTESGEKITVQADEGFISFDHDTVTVVAPAASLV